MRSSKKRSNEEYKGYNLYLKDIHQVDLDIEPMQELMFNIVYNYTGAQQAAATFEKGHAPKGLLDNAKQHMKKFGLEHVTKPMLYSALDELEAMEWVKMVRTEQREVTTTYGGKTKTTIKEIKHYQLTTTSEEIVAVAKRRAKGKSTSANSLF
jgi:hypothetical protein